MSFSDEIQKDPTAITTMLRIRPRLRSRTWVNQNVVGQNIWALAWPLSRGVPLTVTDVGYYGPEVNGMPLTRLEEEDSYADMAADKGTFFYDDEAEILYANFLDLAFPSFESTFPNNRIVFVEWDMYFATQQLNWFVNPIDVNSGDKVWHSGLQKPPVPQQGNPDLLFGYSPVRVTDVQIALGQDSEVMQYLHDWSVNSALVKIWECVGPLAPQNIGEVFTGLAGNYNMQDGTLTIQLTDPLSLIAQPITEEFLSASDFPNIDPQRDLSPKRTILGKAFGYVPINVDFNDTPATNVNRDWVVSKGSLAESPVLEIDVVVGDPVNDTDFTKVVDAFGLEPGNSIILECNGTPEYTNVIEVDYVTNIVRHGFILGRTEGAGDKMYRGFVSNVNLGDREGNAYGLQYGRDWTEVDMADGTRGIILADNFEANIAGCPSPFDPDAHTLYLDVYGSKVVPKKLDGITDFCSLREKGGNMCNPVGFLWDIFRNKLDRFSQLVTMDEAAWFALAGQLDRAVGTAIPESSQGSFGSWQEIIQQILQTELLRLHLKIDSGFATLTITRDAPTVVPGLAISQEELSKPVYNWDYGDVYDAIGFTYKHQEYNEAQFYGFTQWRFEKVSNLARYFHKVSKTLEVKSLLYDDTEVGIVADQFAAVLGERRGTVVGILPTRFTESDIGDTVEYSSKFLPGYQVSANINTRPYKISQHAKSPAGITVTLEDQKGVEDFTGDWEP